MSYENAPATKMLATHCSVCGRPLVDAVSVELGIGPDCRKRYGFNDPCSDEDRKVANALVHKIAMVQKGEDAFAACADLHKLGFVALAARIMDRLTRISLGADGDMLVVETPYNVGFIGDVKAIDGRRWLKEKKAWAVPATVPAKAALLAALTRHFAGKWAQGPKGPFVIPAKAEG